VLHVLRHPLRYTLVALTLGPLFYAVMGLLPWTRWVLTNPWMGLLPGARVEVALTFALTSLVSSWILRRRIATAAGREFLDLAIIGLALGGGVFLWVLQAVDMAWRRALPVEVVDGDWGALILGPVAMPFVGLGFALSALPTTLPLAWLATRTLRWAGGPVPGPPVSVVP